MSHRSGRGISREQMADLPVRRYEGEIVLVESAATLDEAAADIAADTAVGFDTETRPAFRKGESYPPALVQIATARRVYLFPLRQCAAHAVIADLLARETLVKAGVAVAHDLRTLKAVVDFSERSVLDLGTIARRRGFAQTGLRNLVGLCLGFRIAKGAKTTNWAAPRLTPAQIAYAATDAWACRELFLHFRELAWLE